MQNDKAMPSNDAQFYAKKAKIKNKRPSGKGEKTNHFQEQQFSAS